MDIFRRRTPRERMTRLANRRLTLARIRLARSGVQPGPATTAYIDALESLVALTDRPEVDDATLCEHLNHALSMRPGLHHPEVFHIETRGRLTRPQPRVLSRRGAMS